MHFLCWKSSIDIICEKDATCSRSWGCDCNQLYFFCATNYFDFQNYGSFWPLSHCSGFPCSLLCPLDTYLQCCRWLTYQNESTEAWRPSRSGSTLPASCPWPDLSHPSSIHHHPSMRSPFQRLRAGCRLLYCSHCLRLCRSDMLLLLLSEIWSALRNWWHRTVAMLVWS